LVSLLERLERILLEREQELVRKLMTNSITKDDFLSSSKLNWDENSFVNLLEDISGKQDGDALDFAMHIGFVFRLYTPKVVPLLSQLLLEHWHKKHEDMASIFQGLRDPRTCDCLHDCILTNFDYLAFDEAFALAVKCIWALGDIDTEHSMEILKLLADSENPVICRNVQSQLDEEFRKQRRLDLQAKKQGKRL
jgi:hypothetical protein